MNSWDHLKQTRANLAAIKAIREQADPASGVSFAVRRGVARDNEDLDGDDIRRPWVTVELSDLELADNALREIQLGLERLEVFWTKAVRRDIETAQAAIV